MPTMEEIRARLSTNTEMFGENVVQAGHFGHIPGVPVGKIFENRKACSDAKVHVPLVAGISGSSQEGAYSVVLSGAYEDDEDNGDTFTYTGTGGRGGQGSFGGVVVQVENQSFDHPSNRALLVSSGVNGRPVRVVRGWSNKSAFAPYFGFRYDGLYKVEKAYMEEGKSGYSVCKFFFRRLPDQPSLRKREL